MRLLLAALPVSVALVTVPAHAQVDDWDGGYDDRNERRSDFALGVSAAFATGTTTGTLNEIEQFNDDAYDRSTGAAAGSDLTVWLGGAIEDWFTVGIGAAVGGFQGNDILVSQQSFHLRFDLYPLYSLGGPARDLGVTTDFGLGILNGVDADDRDEKVIEGGSLSSLGVGVFWEGWRFARRFGAGPLVHYRLLESQSAMSHTVALGLRLTVYSGPRRAPAAQPEAVAAALERRGSF